MAKAMIQQRLMTTLPRRGRQPKLDLALRLADVSAFTGVGAGTLRDVANKKREVDDALQLQLSSFFDLFESGRIVKIVVGDRCVLRRLATPPGEAPAPRATIDLSGVAPRVIWR